MIQDTTKVEAMIRRDIAVMQQQLVQALQQRDALDRQAQQLHAAIQEWSAMVAEDTHPEVPGVMSGGVPADIPVIITGPDGETLVDTHHQLPPSDATA